MDEENTQAWAGWAVVELMGHRQRGGFVTEQLIAGAPFLRVDIYQSRDIGDQIVAMTQFYPPSAIYCLTPTDEAGARRIGVLCLPADPPARLTATSTAADDVVDDDDFDPGPLDPLQEF